MKEFYVAIAEVYQEVTLATSGYKGAQCGECVACCSAIEISNHKVTPLEFATMEYHLGPEKVNEFKRFIGREKDEGGQLVYASCPNLHPKLGCTVHEVRPLACRLYGHYRSDAAPELHDFCVFRGHEKILPADQEHLLVPGQARLTELTIEYLSYFPPTETATPDSFRAPQTDLERASHLQVIGDREGARDLILELRKTQDSPTLILMLAECYGALKDYKAADAVLDEAIALSPENPELYARKGANLLWAGELPAARAALEKSLSMAPDRYRNLGLLGFVCQLSGDLPGAKAPLARAVELESEPGPFRLQLGLVLRDLGEREAAAAMLHRAKEYEPSRGQAEEALATLG